MEKISFYTTNISKDAVKMVTTTIESGMISSGKKSIEFENELSKRGLKNPVTLNSGTVTMVLALKALDIGYGDEVLLPAQTFIATGMAILQVGAKPVFVDINPHTGNIDSSKIQSKISKKTKAIIVVHWAGYPCDMDEILDICKLNKLYCIEDAAHAFGSSYKDRFIGSISDFTSFSFQAIKHLTTGDGGALCCQSDKHYDRVKKIRWFGIDRDGSKESILGERQYDVSEVGYKAHMNDMAATLGLANLNDIDQVLSKHSKIAKKYKTAFSNHSKIKLLNYQMDRVSSYWIYPILVENRLDFIEELKSKGIPTSVVHLGIDKNSIFGGKDFSLEGQRLFDDNQIHLPIHASITDDQCDHIINTINNF